MSITTANYSNMILAKDSHAEEMTEYIEFYENREKLTKHSFVNYKQFGIRAQEALKSLKPPHPLDFAYLAPRKAVVKYFLLCIVENTELQKHGRALRDHDIINVKKYETSVLQNLQSQLDHIMFDFSDEDAEQLKTILNCFKVDETVIRIGKRMLNLQKVFKKDLVWIYDFNDYFKDVKCKGGCGGCQGCGR